MLWKRPFRFTLDWHGIVIALVVAITALCGGCQPSSPGSAPTPSTRSSGGSAPERSLAPAPLANPNDNRPLGIVFDVCGCVCKKDDAVVKGAVFVHKASTNTKVSVQAFLMETPNAPPPPAVTLTAKGNSIPTTKAGGVYSFTISAATLGLPGNTFLPVGTYVIVATVVDNPGPNEKKYYVSADLFVEDCGKHLRFFKAIVQDVPASVLPQPSDLLTVHQNIPAVQLAVSLSGGASATDSINMTFFDASNPTQEIAGSATTVTINQGLTTGYLPIPSNSVLLSTPRQVIAVATFKGNSVSNSFTVQ